MQRRRKTVLFVLLLSFVFWQMTAGSDEEQQIYLLKMERIRLQQQIAKLKKDRAQLQQDGTAYASSHQTRLQSLRKRVSDAEQQLRDERTRSAAVLGGLRQQQYLLAVRRGMLERFMQRNRELITGWKTSVAGAVPMLADKEAAAADALLSESRLAGVSALELYNRFWTVLRAAVTGSFDSRSVTDEKQTQYRLLRIGRLLQYRSGEERAAFQFRTAKGWEWRSTPLTAADRLAVRDGVRMVDGKKAPDFVLLPIPSGLFSVPGGKK